MILSGKCFNYNVLIIIIVYVRFYASGLTVISSPIYYVRATFLYKGHQENVEAISKSIFPD